MVFTLVAPLSVLRSSVEAPIGTKRRSVDERKDLYGFQFEETTDDGEDDARADRQGKARAKAGEEAGGSRGAAG
jgi:hypothetical protein